MKRILLSVLMLFTAISVHAEEVVVPATGFGDTFEQAIESALGNAIKQVNGASVATQSGGPKVYAQVKTTEDVQASGSIDATYEQQTKEGGLLKDKVNEDKEALKIDGEMQGKASSKTTLEAGIGGTTDVRSQGKVKRYNVVKQECTDKGCTVELSVTIEKFEYKSKEPKLERDSIAVVTTGRLRNSASAAQIRELVVGKLAKTGRFSVLDRSNDAVFEKENDFLSSDNVSDQERARLGQASGADYMLIINLTQAGVATKVEENYVGITGEYSRDVSQSTRASVRFTLVDSATRAIKWADTISYTAAGNKISAAMEEFQDKIVADIAETVSPAKVIAVQNGRIIINRGTGIATEGQTYDIYSLGEALIDPDTGESLGATEEKVATIKIDEIKAKVAYGSVVTGKADAIAKGSVARIAKPAKAEAPKKSTGKKAAPKSDQKIDDAGGIVL